VRAAWLVRVAIVAGLLGAWYLGTELGLIPDNRLPPPAEVGSALTEEWKEILGYVGETVLRVGAGFALGLVAGVAVALLTSLMPRLGDVLAPAVEVLRSIPPFVLAPFVLLWFGLGFRGPVLFVAWTTFFIVLIDAIEALRNVSQSHKWVAASLGASRLQRVIRVELPAIVPGIIGGMRIALVGGMNVVVLYELLTGSNGIGYMLIRGYQLFRLETLFAAVIVAVVLTLALDLLLRLASRYAVRWMP
jgi:ABC-type nitrate/sulfonate/bicarbonate transport system permease component